MNDNHEFKHALGSSGKDTISGFSGVITAAAQFFTGCDRYEITPEKTGEDGKPLDGHYFDADRIESGKTGSSVEFQHVLGSQVKDIVTGFEGRVMLRTAYLHSSNRYGLIRINAASKSDMEWIHFDEAQLIATSKKTIVLPKQENSKPGGVPCRETPQR